MLFGHTYVGPLNREGKTMLSQMTKNFEKPSQSFFMVKDKDQRNVTTNKIVYDE